jgi:hypothetical protein
MTMRHTKLKMERAKIHLDALGVRVREFIESKPYRIMFKDDLERQEYKLIVEMDDPPLDAALIAGDFICCLRSLLDHIVWQIAAQTGIAKLPFRTSAFPIFGENILDTQLAIAKATFGLPDEVTALIKSFQPYHAGDRYKFHYLWVLNHLWNIDKHRHIPLHSGALQFDFAPESVKPIRAQAFDDHGEMIFPLSAKDNIKFNPRDAEVQFGDQSEGIVIPYEGLVNIYMSVRDSVFPQFARFFS